MGEFADRFAGLSADRQRARYRRLAEAALAHYAIGEANAVFLQHNGGVAYRVEAERAGQRFLLKIAAPVGEGTGPEPGHLRSALVWLAALAREGDPVVQRPVPNRRGELLTTVPFGDLREPLCCSLQRWLDGDHAAGDLTPEQTRRVGAMMARLHRHGSRWTAVGALERAELDAAWLDEQVRGLRGVVETAVVSADEWATVEVAHRRIRAVMEQLGRGPAVWGPVHGDLHQGNLLFYRDEVRPIDFGGLRFAHFAYDLGTMLYHTLYLDADVRRALLAGYQAVRPLDDLAHPQADAFVCAAALANLAFQVTIPRERASPLFARNVREFAGVFCRKLAAGEPFAFS